MLIDFCVDPVGSRARSPYLDRVAGLLVRMAVVCAALIPLLSGLRVTPWLTGSVGAPIVLEGLQQLNQYQQNWIRYRSTCESLKHEKYLYLAKAGPYAGVSDAHALLAERVESLVSQEEGKWVSAQEKAEGPAKKGLTSLGRAARRSNLNYDDILIPGDARSRACFEELKRESGATPEQGSGWLPRACPTLQNAIQTRFRKIPPLLVGSWNAIPGFLLDQLEVISGQKSAPGTSRVISPNPVSWELRGLVAGRAVLASYR